MELEQLIKPGMTKEETFLVKEEHSARHVGSGSLRVLATPWMIGFVERVCQKLLAEHLPQGFTSVGVRVDVQHLAPTPVGSLVRVRGEVSSLDGNKVNFQVEAWDEQEKIGTGQHQRVVIDEARFLRRVATKLDRKESIV
jgi:fluoroacetyl-CoA thioesterase